jgi:inosine/xanthosine triphosphatase
MEVVVGSRNPVKVAAAEAVMRRIYADGVRVRALAVNSGVPAQPWGDTETRRGAINRARAVLRQTDAAWGIGFEGGVLEVDGEVYTSAWCAVARPDGALGVAGGENLLLPPRVVAELRVGKELGRAVDVVSGEHNTKQKGGAIGAFTGGYLSRQSAYEHLLILALARFLSPGYYQ